MFKQSTLKGVLVYDEGYSSDRALIGAAIGGGVPDGSWEWQQLLDQVLLSFSASGNKTVAGTYLVVEEGDSDGIFIIKASDSMHEKGILLSEHPSKSLPPHMPAQTVGFLKVVTKGDDETKYDAVLIVFDEKFIESNPELSALGEENDDDAEASPEVSAVIIGSSVDAGVLVPTPEMDEKMLSKMAESMIVMEEPAPPQ